MTPSQFSEALFTMGIRLTCAEYGLPMPKRRPCERCDGDAWFVESDTRDGRVVEVYRCVDGHVALVQH